LDYSYYARAVLSKLHVQYAITSYVLELLLIRACGFEGVQLQVEVLVLVDTRA